MPMKRLLASMLSTTTPYTTAATRSAVRSLTPATPGWTWGTQVGVLNAVSRDQPRSIRPTFWNSLRSR
ncbi:hypothetical protein A8926_0293 [Saccharopolyspora spinosa]|uniref:Secreted protein n=1 Tax=Saccharopolyspora spinosa TaxID=60894 RepID=A0A2N3XQ62_SACSN|nr:hypothetical protein A8926_0293 [Saccharopolyspora spinosa]